MDFILENRHLQKIAEVLTQGDPPLILQLLAVNVVWMVWWIFLQTKRRGKVRPSTLRLLQLSMLGLNVFVLTVPGNDMYRLVGI